MAENVANVYVGVIPTTEGIHQQLSAAFMPAAAKIGAQSGKAFDKSFGQSIGGISKSAGVLGKELSRSMGAVVKAGHGSKLADEFRRGFRTIGSDVGLATRPVERIGEAFGRALSPARTFTSTAKAGFRDLTGETKTFTGVIPGIGSAMGRAAGAGLRPLGQFRDGFKSSAAAASSWTGTMGTIGGKVGGAFRAIAAPVDGAMGKIHGFRTNAEGSFARVTGAARNLASNVGSAFSSFGGAVAGAASSIASFGTSAAAALGLAAAAAIGAAGSVGISTAAQMETANISFTTMLGSAEKAEKFLGDLTDFAAKTPFDLPGLQRSAQSLVSIGIETDKVIPIMTTLGNVTSGMGTGAEGVNRATIAIQQMNAAGRITAEDLNQLRDAGVPVFDLLTAATGKTTEEIAHMAQNGKLGREELEQLMTALETGKGLERFTGMMEKQSASLTGLWSTLKDTFSVGMAEAIEPAIPLIKDGLGGAIEGVSAVMPAVSSALSAVVTNAVEIGRIGKSVFDALRGEAFTTAPAIALGFAPFEGVGGVITEILGSYRAFVAAVVSGGNDITSSGVAGWFEGLGLKVRGWIDQLRPVVEQVLPSIKNGFSQTFRIVGAIVAAVAPVIVDAVSIIVDVFAKLWPPVMRFASAVTDILGPVVSVAVFALGKVIQWLLNAIVGPVFRGIASVIGWALDGVVTPILKGIAWLLTGGVGEAFQWVGDTATRVWSAIGDVLARVGGWITGTALPAIQRAVDATGAGIRWFGDNVVRPVLEAVGAAFRWFGDNIVGPVMRAVLAVVTMVAAAVVGIFQGIAWVLQKTLGPAFRWFNDAVIQPVWRAIRAGIEAVSTWWTNTAVPFIRTGIDGLARAFRWVNDVVVQPVWRAIRAGIAAVATWWVGTALPLIRGGVDRLAAAFRWVNDVVIQPVWRGIRAGINAVVSWWNGTAIPAIRGGIDRVAGAFRWVRDVISGAWGAIRDRVADGWAKIRDNVFTPMKRWLTESIPQWFRDTRDGIGKIWDKVVDKVREPIRKIVDVVINKGLIDNYNRLNNVWSGGDIDHMTLDGWRSGGYTGAGNPNKIAGYVHRDEEVIRSESRRDVERHAPGFLSDVNARGAAALERFQNPAHAAVGAAVYGGRGSFSNPLQHAIYASGKLNVRGGGAGWGVDQAIGMIDRATRVKVGRGVVGAPTLNVQAGAMPAWWAGYYEGNTVRLNSAAIGPGRGRTTVAAHELGHAMGLPHSDPSGIQSIMSYANMYAHNSVTGADVRALGAIYGGSGFASGSSTGEEDPKPGWIRKILDFVMKPFREWKETFGGNKLGEMIAGIAQKVIDGIKTKIGIPTDTGAAAPVEVFDNGGKLRKSATPKLVQHRDTKPDYVFNHAQWQTLGTLAKTAAEQAAADGGRAGTTIEVENMFGSPEKIAADLDRKRRRANTAAGIGRIRKVVI